MESEVIRLRVSWRRDASRGETLQAVVKAVYTGFGTRLATDGEPATQMALRYEDDDGDPGRLFRHFEQHGETLRGANATGGEG